MSSNNAKLNSWVAEFEALCQPDRVQWCNGSQAEHDEMVRLMLDAGTARKLDARPNSYLVWSDPADVARVEDRTFICSENEIDAGPHEQLGRSSGNEDEAPWPLRGLHARGARCT